jgi:hypothetical protein
MRVIPPRARWSRCQVVPQRFSGRNYLRALLYGAVVQGVGRESVPMHNVLFCCRVGHVNRNGSAFLHAQHWARHLSVVSNRLNENTLTDVDRAWLDPQTESIAGSRLVRTNPPQSQCGQSRRERTLRQKSTCCSKKRSSIQSRHQVHRRFYQTEITSCIQIYYS